MVRGIIRTVVVLAVATLAGGCLDFKEQTVTYRYDSATDTLLIFQDYRGIFGDDRTDTLTPEELDQLDSMLTTERALFFANWIWELNREELKHELEKFREQPAEEHTPIAISTAALQQRLLDALHVVNGPVYFDAQHRLSAVQQVTLSHVTPLIAAANEFFSESFRVEAGKPNLTTYERALYLRAFGAHRESIVRRGNAFLVRLPVPREDYEENEEDHQRLRKGGMLVEFANDEMTWQIGLPSDVVTEITVPVRAADYVPNAVESFRRRVPILDAFDAPGAARAFLATGASFDAEPGFKPSR